MLSGMALELLVFETVGLELQRAGVLCDVAGLVLGVAVGRAGGDLDANFQLDTCWRS